MPKSSPDLLWSKLMLSVCVVLASRFDVGRSINVVVVIVVIVVVVVEVTLL